MPVPASIDDLSTTASENSPLGSEQVFPQLDNYLRAQASFIAQLRDEVRASGLPIGGSMWWGGLRAALPANLMPEDGDLVNRVDYPELWAFVSNGGYPVVPESDWQADNKKRGSFSLGDGSTTFRMPDNNGKTTGSYGATVKRGDGIKSAGAPGLIQDSQNKEHTHAASTNQTGAHSHSITDSGHTHPGTGAAQRAGGVEYVVTGGNPYFDGIRANQATQTGISINSSGSHSHTVTIENQGGTEARGVSVTGCHVMRVK